MSKFKSGDQFFVSYMEGIFTVTDVVGEGYVTEREGERDVQRTFVWADEADMVPV